MGSVVYCSVSGMFLDIYRKPRWRSLDKPNDRQSVMTYHKMCIICIMIEKDLCFWCRPYGSQVPPFTCTLYNQWYHRPLSSQINENQESSLKTNKMTVTGPGSSLNSYSAGIYLRRQILTSKVHPRDVRLQIFIIVINP